MMHYGSIIDSLPYLASYLYMDVDNHFLIDFFVRINVFFITCINIKRIKIYGNKSDIGRLELRNRTAQAANC